MKHPRPFPFPFIPFPFFPLKPLLFPFPFPLNIPLPLNPFPLPLYTISFPSFQCSNIHVDWTVIPAWHYQMSALDVTIHNLQCFSERRDVPDIQPQVLLQWTSSFLHYQGDQQIIVQRHSSRLLMSVLQYDEVTQVTLKMITPQSKGNDLIQEIRRTSSRRQ